MGNLSDTQEATDQVVSLLLKRLHAGVSAEEMRPAFDPRSRWIYRLIAAEIVAAALLILATGFKVDPAALVALPLWASCLGIGGLMLRRVGHSRAGSALELVALIYGQGFSVLFLLFPLTAVSLPFADHTLEFADGAIGFDWATFAAIFRDHPAAIHGFVRIYKSFEWQPLLVVGLLLAGQREGRAWLFVTAAALASAVTALIYPFAPAVGTFIHFGITPADYPNLAGDGPWHFGPILHMIKDQHLRVITPTLFTGMVSFPSYHAAAAVLFAWAAWPLRRARWPFVLLNVGVCLSAMIVGAHYLVDILAGVTIGACSILISRYLLSQPILADDIGGSCQ